MTIDAKRVGQRDSRFTPGLAGDLRGPLKGLFRFRSVPQVAFQIRDLRAGHNLRVDIGCREIHASAKIRVHRALAIGRNEDEAASRRWTGRRGCRVEADALRAQIMPKYFAELVVPDFPE